MRSAQVVGVHPIKAREPCHLIELAIRDPGGDFKVDDLTQIDENVGKDSWQVAYDERFLDGQSLLPLSLRPFERPDQKEYRLVFFFHYLDLTKPLQTSFGPLALPQPSPRPAYLAFMRYVSP